MVNHIKVCGWDISDYWIFLLYFSGAFKFFPHNFLFAAQGYKCSKPSQFWIAVFDKNHMGVIKANLEVMNEVF